MVVDKLRVLWNQGFPSEQFWSSSGQTYVLEVSCQVDRILLKHTVNMLVELGVQGKNVRRHSKTGNDNPAHGKGEVKDS